jgi:pimeloyl-ACP methyl ester carboxylesterase
MNPLPSTSAVLWLTLAAATAAPGAGAAAPDAPAGQGITLQPCRISDSLGLRSHAARCGTLTRPENPSDPQGRQVELFVAVVPAVTPTPAPDAMTAIAGGPGGASTEFYAGFAQAFEHVRRQRDIVLVDQRGTGRSNALDCAFLDVEVAATSPEEITRLTEQCLDGLDGDPRYFTTSIAVDDLDAVRAALGYTQLNVYGASYGTRVALHYLRRHPERTRSVILDGVVPAQIPIAPEIATDAQAALERVFSRCQADSACAERFPSLREQFESLRRRLRDEAVEVSLQDPLTGEPRTVSVDEGHLRIATRLLSYNPYSVSVMPLILEQASTGNLVPLAAQALTMLDSLDESLSYGMHNAVVCTEDAPFFDDFLRRELGRDALVDTYLGAEQLETLETMCETWPAGVLDEDFKSPVVSDHPVLVLSGSDDPITPPRNGERAIGANGEYLSNALHIVVPGQGHGVAGTGCLPRLVGAFVDQATVDELDTDCVDRLGPAAFFVDFATTAP